MSESTKKKRNRQSKPISERRVQVAARVHPLTKAYLDSLNQRNMGRAIDKLVELLTSSV